MLLHFIIIVPYLVIVKVVICPIINSIFDFIIGSFIEWIISKFQFTTKCNDLRLKYKATQLDVSMITIIKSTFKPFITMQLGLHPSFNSWYHCHCSILSISYIISHNKENIVYVEKSIQLRNKDDFSSVNFFIFQLNVCRLNQWFEC